MWIKLIKNINLFISPTINILILDKKKQKINSKLNKSIYSFKSK